MYLNDSITPLAFTSYSFKEKKIWFLNYLKANDKDTLNILVTMKKSYGESPSIEYTAKTFSIRIDNLKQNFILVALPSKNIIVNSDDVTSDDVTSDDVTSDDAVMENYKGWRDILQNKLFTGCFMG